MKRLLIALPLAFALGCGSEKPNLVVIGNSITYNAPNASVDWSGSWGMAASAVDKDFAHETAAALKLPLVGVFNLLTVEHLVPSYTNDIAHAAAAVTPGSVVVVELGDNARETDPKAFAAAYNLLLTSVARRWQLICASTWWENPSIDTMIEPSCKAAGGTYVYIGDIYTDPKNPDYSPVVFSNGSVEIHPHNWGMQQISNRIAAVTR